MRCPVLLRKHIDGHSQALCVSASYTHYLHRLPLEYELCLLDGFGSFLTPCYWSGYYDFLYFWLADCFFHFWIIRIIYSRIIYGIVIIYFYIFWQYRLTARASLFAVARYFIKIQYVPPTLLFASAWRLVGLRRTQRYFRWMAPNSPDLRAYGTGHGM